MTGIQRKVLTFMAEAGGSALIGTGYRDTEFGKDRSTGEPAVRGSVVVLQGLLHQGLVESAAKWPLPRYRLTNKARAALSRMRKAAPDTPNPPPTLRVSDDRGFRPNRKGVWR